MRLLISIFLLLAPALGWGQETVKQIQDCVRGNLPETTASHDLRLISEDPGGGQRELRATLYGKEVGSDRIAVMLAVSGPPDLAGSRYLLVDKGGRDDMYMYLPALNRTRRILGNMTSQPLWGTDFSYEDVKHIQGIMLDGDIGLGEAAEIDGRPVHILKIRPGAEEESAYQLIKVSIDKKTCLMLATEFHDESGLSKRLRVNPETFAQHKGRWLAHSFVMENTRAGTRSMLELEGIAYDERISANRFNPKTFHLGD